MKQGAFDLEEWPPRVAFDEFGEWSLNLRVYYWYRLGEGDDERNWYTYLDHCSVVNERILERFNEAGIGFAFPTRTLHVEGDRRSPRGEDAESPAGDNGTDGGEGRDTTAPPGERPGILP